MLNIQKIVRVAKIDSCQVGGLDVGSICGCGRWVGGSGNSTPARTAPCARSPERKRL